VAYQTTRRRGSYLASSSRQRRTTLTAAVGAAATETAGTSADDAKDLSQHIFVETESNNGQGLWLEGTLPCYPTAQLYSQLNHRNSVYLHTLIHFSSCMCLYASAPASAFGVVSAHAQDHVLRAHLKTHISCPHNSWLINSKYRSIEDSFQRERDTGIRLFFTSHVPGCHSTYDGKID
jgi:hypothetical protein